MLSCFSTTPMNVLVACLVFVLVTSRAQGNPWLFQEIKPLTDSDIVKKSNIPELQVKDVNPTKPTILIKEDIREDILGKNESSSKFKEGVKKLLDFLEAGPNAADQSPEHKTEDKADNNNLKQDDTLIPNKQDDHSVINQGNEVASKVPVTNADQSTSLDKDSHPENIKPIKESNSNFVKQQNEPPAIPMRSEIHNNKALPNPVSQPHDGPIGKSQPVLANNPSPKSQLQHGMIAKSQIPYSTVSYNTAMKQMFQSNAMVRSEIPNTGLTNTQQYNNPYLAYQRSSLPYRVGLNPGYKVAQRPNTIATQAIRYPYSQRRMLPMKTNTFTTARRSNIRLPFYKGTTITSTYHPQQPYARTYIPSQLTRRYTSPALIRKPFIAPKAPMSLLASRVHVPAVGYLQTPHQTLYQRMPNWNLFGRNAVSKPTATSNGLKFRRMAINNRGKAYNGLPSTRDKVAQKTPLPLPLASIMTAARIVVPARPITLNGAQKSNVETLSSTDPEEKGARAV